jgi:predicted nuclease of predicted toxin-antitoxin system
MKILVDQNLPPIIAEFLQRDFPGSAHVRDVGLRDALDSEVWRYARDEGFTIMSKDSDFRQRAFLFGHPPKVIWIRTGNCPTARLWGTVEGSKTLIRNFIDDDAGAVLALP